MPATKQTSNGRNAKAESRWSLPLQARAATQAMAFFACLTVLVSSSLSCDEPGSESVRTPKLMSMAAGDGSENHEVIVDPVNGGSQTSGALRPPEVGMVWADSRPLPAPHEAARWGFGPGSGLGFLDKSKADLSPTEEKAFDSESDAQSDAGVTDRPSEVPAPPVQVPRIMVGLNGYAKPMVKADSWFPRGEAERVEMPAVGRGDAETVAIETLARELNGRVRHSLGSIPGWWVLEFESVDDANAAHERVLAEGLAVESHLDYLVEIKHCSNDPLFANQWHLKNTGQGGRQIGLDYNVEPAWAAGWTGQGIRVAVLDDGVDFTNPDLAASHYAAGSRDFLRGIPGGLPFLTGDNHGTPCAGLVGARTNNSIGVAAPAYGCQMSGLRMLGTSSSTSVLADSLSHLTTDFHIYSNSWGPANEQDYVTLLGPPEKVAIETGISTGRSGRGAVYLFAGGNGRDNFDSNTNYSSSSNLPHIITVAAMSGSGTFASYSNPGASILIAGFAGDSDVWTTDRVGSLGMVQGDYTGVMDGTSAATPGVAGVVALMLQARPTLTWRDVQHVLARSARKNYFSPYSSWQQNGAGHWISHDWGFGTADAAAATSLAQTWPLVSTRQTYPSSYQNVNQTIPTGQTPLSLTYTVPSSQNLRCEHVQVEVRFSHQQWGEIEVELVSPYGTVSRLASVRQGHKSGPSDDWTYMTVQSWDEYSSGTWTLRLRDGVSGAPGSIVRWKLIVHGTALPALPSFNATNFNVPLPTPLNPGTSLSNISASISNTGNFAGTCSYRMYISTSATANSGTGIVLRESISPSIAAFTGVWNGTGLTGQVPSTTPPGSYYVYLYITDQNFGTTRVIRSSTAGFVVTATTLADVFPYNLSVYPETAAPGQTVTLSYSVANYGGVASGTFYAGAYWTNTSAWVTSSSNEYWQHTNLPTMTYQGVFNRQIVVPQTMTAGQRYLWVWADDINQVTESNEANNHVSIPISIVIPVPFICILDDQPATVPASTSQSNINLIIDNGGWWQSVAIGSTSDWDLGIGTASSLFGAGYSDFIVANGNKGALTTSGWIERYSGTVGAALHYSRARGSSTAFSFSGNRVIQIRELYSSGSQPLNVRVEGTSTHIDFRWFVYNPGSDSTWRNRADATFGGPFGFAVGSTPQLLNLNEVGFWCIVVVQEGGPGLSATFTVTAEPAASPKDVNRDGNVDVVDVQSVVNLILGSTLAQYVGQGDANSDSVVDVVDVQTIVNCILSIGPCN